MIDRRKKILMVSSSGALASALLFAVLFTASAATARGLVVTFFDVGQGDSALIQTPQHQNIVIDGGPDGGIMGKIGAAVPFYDRTIDLMILTHPHADHVVGLIEILDRYEIKKILINGLEHDTPEHRAFIKAVFRHRIPLVVAREREAFQFGDGCILTIHTARQKSFRHHGKRAPSDEDLNDSSIVAMLTYNSHSFIMMGDAGEPVESELLAAGFVADSTVLKVGHHGSRGASSLPFLKAVRPEIAIVSSGAHNSYGHPHREALQRLQKSGALVYRTDEQGDIRITSNGSELSVSTSR